MVFSAPIRAETSKKMCIVIVPLNLFLYSNMCPCVAGSDHRLSVQPSCSCILPTNLRQDRQLLHDGPLRSARNHPVTRGLRTCCFLSGFVEHLSGRYCSGSWHCCRRCFGYPCKLSAGASSRSTAVLTSFNYTTY